MTKPLSGPLISQSNRPQHVLQSGKQLWHFLFSFIEEIWSGIKAILANIGTALAQLYCNWPGPKREIIFLYSRPTFSLVRKKMKKTYLNSSLLSSEFTYLERKPRLQYFSGRKQIFWQHVLDAPYISMPATVGAHTTPPSTCVHLIATIDVEYRALPL